MALLGKGLLAIWNGMTEAGEAEFVRWHIREHIPERVGLTGFLRGRRYVALDGNPKYFNFYETESPQTLQSPEYRARLNAPTPWTQAVVKEFRDTSRTLCKVVASIGAGEGAWIETIQISGVEDRTAFSQSVVNVLMKKVAEQDGIVAVHLVRAIDGQGVSATAESALRKQPDARCEWLLLVEAADADFLKNTRASSCSSDALRKAAAPSVKVERGIYRLQYGLTHAELGRLG
jgi:hypothetical protein